MAKKTATKPKFSDKPQKAGLLTRLCPTCGVYHHPRAAQCPKCLHTYKKKASKVVKRKVAAPKTTLTRKDPLDAGIALVAACRGDVVAARKVLDTIDSIKKL